MLDSLIKKFADIFLILKVRKVEREIGYKLAFRDVPDRYIQGWVSWDMTQSFRKFGLNVEAGMDYWTMGKIVHGKSTRFDPAASEYQSWLGGYIVKLPSSKPWTPEDHFRLAIADQDGWLKTYGDSAPITSIEGEKFVPVETLRVHGYQGKLYEFGCTTHSDIGDDNTNLRLQIESRFIASLFNASNPSLRLMGDMFVPEITMKTSYETLQLRGYIAIFDIGDRVKIVLYGNGTDTTFAALKDDLRAAMEACEIIKL